MKHLYLIAGCNGAGKTTATATLLPASMGLKEYVNADEIAKGLSPFNPESMAFVAGRIMLTRINQLLAAGESFSIETTLSTRSYVGLVRSARENGYIVHIIFLWLKSAEAAKERVRKRVSSGGHNIPPEVIERRYHRGIQNLFDIYMNEADIWVLCDNNLGECERIAFGSRISGIKIKDKTKFKAIISTLPPEIRNKITPEETRPRIRFKL